MRAGIPTGPFCRGKSQKCAFLWLKGAILLHEAEVLLAGLAVLLKRATAWPQ